MCTLAWGKEDNSLWICFNRDELRKRQPAEPPAIHRGAGPATVYARDPQGGGTWFAASEAGFAVALLNHYPAEAPVQAPTRSRGQLVIDLAEAASEARAHEILLGADLAPYAPFCLFLLSMEGTGAFAWDGDQLQPLACERPFWTTSSYKPEEVLAWRTGWWLARIEDRELKLAEASRLMRQAWPGKPAYGLTMDRMEARTLSQIELRIAPQGLTFVYRQREAEGTGYGKPVSIQLPA